MKLVTVCEQDDGIRLDKWFKRHYQSVPFGVIAKLIRKGQIKLNSKKTDVATRLAVGDVIAYKDFEVREVRKTHLPNHLEKEILNTILYEDQDILVLNKPSGLAVQGGSGIKYSIDDLVEFLKNDQGEKPKLVHRLDKQTSGILIMAKTANIAAKLSELFQNRDIKKTYIALVKGLPRPFSGKIDIPIEKLNEDGFEKVKEGKKKAITMYSVIDHAADQVALVSFDLITGRTHQIRVHSSMIGHPIMGDSKYANPKFILNDVEDNLYLHSLSIDFRFGGRDYHFKAPLPKHFKEAMKTLGLSFK